MKTIKLPLRFAALCLAMVSASSLGCSSASSGEQVGTTDDDLEVLGHENISDGDAPFDDSDLDRAVALADAPDPVDLDTGRIDGYTAADGVYHGVPLVTGDMETEALLKAGMHPKESAALRNIGVSAARIMQTLGNAPASAGTHGVDGFVNGHPYCAAVDISVRGMSHARIRAFLLTLAKAGFAAWFRWPGHDGWPASEITHIHAIYVGVHIKQLLRDQAHDWFEGRTGLVGHAHYQFYQWPASARTHVEHMYNIGNGGGGGGGNGSGHCVPGGFYCGGDKVSGDRNTLYRCTSGDNGTVVRHCANGCAVRPGQDDACR